MYPLLNQAAHLTSFPEKSKFLCFSMLANTGHDKAYPLSDQIDTPNTAGYKANKVDSKKSKNARISQATQTLNRKPPDTAMRVSAFEPIIHTEWKKILEVKRHDDAPQSHEHSIGSAGTEGVSTVLKFSVNKCAGT